MISSTGESENIVTDLQSYIGWNPRGSIFSPNQNTQGIGTQNTEEISPDQCLGEAASRTQKWRIRYQSLEFKKGH